MKKYIEAWEKAIVAETYESENAVVHICTDDLFINDSAERQKEVVNRLAYEFLYRQALRKAEKLRST